MDPKAIAPSGHGSLMNVARSPSENVPHRESPGPISRHLTANEP